MEEPDRDLATLLSRHKEAINALREGAKSVLGPEHDDIFLLRYVLSFSPADALEAIKWAVAWRKEPRNAYWLSRAEEKEKSLMKLNDPSKTDKSASINISAYHKVERRGGLLWRGREECVLLNHSFFFRG